VAPLASQGRCCRILVLDLYYLSAEIESHLVFQTTSTQDKPMKNNIIKTIMPHEYKILEAYDDMLQTKFLNWITACGVDKLNKQSAPTQKNKHLYLQLL